MVAWSELRCFLVETYGVVPVLNFGAPRYGWNLQHHKGARPLCEMYPECGSFCALVVLGKKELEQALERWESFGLTVRQALADTPRFHDCCWLYMRVNEAAYLRAGRARYRTADFDQEEGAKKEIAFK